MDFIKTLLASSDTLLGMILGAIILIVSQIILHKAIEKWKLKTEREFNFQKELYFYLQQKNEIIIASLEQDYLDIRQTNPDEAIYLKKQDRIEIKESERTSLINIYFPEAKKDFEKYDVIHWNIILFINEWEFLWQEHASDRFNQELKFYKKTLDNLKESLYNLLLKNKPN